MRRLMLLRHAKTERDAPGGKDSDRRLDERGRLDAVRIGTWLAKQGRIPDLVLVSTAVRAQETWDLMAEALPRVKVERLPELYSADVGDLLQIIHAADTHDPAALMIVAHNPTLHEMALMLAGEGDAGARDGLADNLPTSGLVVIDFASDDWADVSFRRGRLELFVSPKQLKDAAGGV